MDIKEYVTDIAKRAKAASRTLATLSTDVKNTALLKMADRLEEQAAAIIEANKKDMADGEAKGLSKAMLDRLMLDEKRVKGMADTLREVAGLPDPVGEVIRMWKRPNGLQIGKVRVPIGVVGIIYESRPNVTADAASLCLKTGNAVILRGGSEAIHSNTAIAKALKEAGAEAGIPADAVAVMEITDRAAVMEMLKLDKFVDLVIPRGGEALIKAVAENSTVPVVKHDKGLCHTYVDEDADPMMALKICYNAKVQRPGVCNAMETLLVHKKAADGWLPAIGKKFKEAGVEIRGCERTLKILPYAVAASAEDWDTEYLDLIISVKVVDSLQEAIDHIAEHGSSHSEAIITENYSHAQRFLQEVDAAAVYVNASTRFTDGGQFGLGAEVGISTSKLHARGPMGLEDLTTTKYIIYGSGQVRK
ncbi:MAG: glutamate-5-semialdehyde dehydrogenase [Nitrospirota bacterium]|nr:glutamate-5-semialdehyde dehydrogenase [Nitrospirota bacterium]